MTLLPVLAVPALLLAAGYAVTVVAPATAGANTHRTAATRDYTKGGVQGRHVYANNGCVACHTLARRDTFTDASLGTPTGVGEDLNDRPALLGDARYGPDLSCVGSRVPGWQPAAGNDAKVDAMVAYLQQPSAMHHGSTMPSYRFLRSADLRHLAEFLVDHTCAEAAK